MMTEREHEVANLLYTLRKYLNLDEDSIIEWANALLKDPDLVKVVRCGNCRYWEPPSKEEVEDGCTYGQCHNNGAGADVNDFCSSGERG